MEIVLAIVLGLLFGFILQRIGAADPDKIIGMLRLTDLQLMKTILTAIGLSTALLFIGLAVGVISASHLSVKAMYGGVVIGGAILGFGWALSGFCPGTGLVAAGAGRRDAWFFILGGLMGAGIFTYFYDVIADLALMQDLFGGKTTLASAGVNTLLPFVSGWLVAVVVGAVIIAIAFLLPVSLRQSGKK